MFCLLATHFWKIYSKFSLKNFIEFTDDGEVEIGRDARLGAHLTLVDARIPRLDVFDLQDPVLGLRLMDHMPRQTRVTRQRGVRPVGHSEPLVRRVREQTCRQDV